VQTVKDCASEFGSPAPREAAWWNAMMLMHARALLLFAREHVAWAPDDPAGAAAKTERLRCDLPLAFGAEAQQRLGDRSAVCAALAQVCAQRTHAHMRICAKMRIACAAPARVRSLRGSQR
jgi:hypothetical protein